MTAPAHRLHPNLLSHCVELLQEVQLTTLPADARIHTYFRTQKQLGSRDRGFIAETVYGVLRQRRLLEYLIQPFAVTPGTLVASYLLHIGGLSARALEEAKFTHSAAVGVRELVEQIRGCDKSQLPLAARANLPDWLLDRLLPQYGEAHTLIIAQSMNQPASVDVRINTLKASREQVAHSLEQEGYATLATPYSAVGLRRDKRGPLNQTSAFKNGWIEVQDEGSQLLAVLLEPQPGTQVVDFCAGAGGKTLQLGALMQNRGSLYALDIAEKRLQQFKPRLRRAGLDNVRSILIRDENDVHVKRLRGKIDRVLVDAPCSGTGTLRRNPDIKWREINLTALTTTQTAILAAAAKLLKPGGRLVYATCSILPDENEQIITAFLNTHADFSIIPVNTILQRLAIPLTMPSDALRLWPHEHHTDGFFAMVLERGLTPRQN